MKYLLSLPIATLSLLTFDPKLSQGRNVSLSFEPAQKQNNDYVLSAPFYTLEDSAFQKLWDQAKGQMRSRIVEEFASPDYKFTVTRGDKIYVWLKAPSPGYDFDTLAYRYTLFDRDKVQIGKPASVQVIGVREWIKNRGRPPANIDLPIAWYGNGRSAYLKVEFVQNGRTFTKEWIRP